MCGDRRGQSAQRTLAGALAAVGADRRRRPCRVGLLVRRLARALRQPRTACAVDLDRTDRLRRGGPGCGLARSAVVAARCLGGGGAAQPAQRRARAESVGRLLPHRANRVEPVDRRTAAGPDRSGHRDRHAAAAQDPAEGHRGAGRHQRRGIGFQAPRRAGLSPAGLVRHQPTAAAADGDDDRWRVQHPRRLAAYRPGDQDDRRFRRRPSRQRTCSGVRRLRRCVQQRHRVRQRQPWQRRRPPDQRRCAVYGLELRREPRPRPTGASSAGRWAAPARSTSR